METARSVRLAFWPKDWFVSIDLKDAYLLVLMRPLSHRYLKFVWEEAVFQFKALFFVLSSAPQVFTRICAVVEFLLHYQDIRLLRYLVDWLLLASS